jgi:hypothetical protein
LDMKALLGKIYLMLHRWVLFHKES